ncbi:phosphate acyltransferase [Luteolibacter flavescens]|uniref:Phosphate acyltransferase n=1 Tax=Luteolibacter flavescens TaxID=1859460 RepID=A0ABT3FR60_9BACT|nr:phosphate acyltransferase [Luteolibacter flavescens]MCW1886081.1 phosphate acyltransferase [Luteolibacter flavescens]
MSQDPSSALSASNPFTDYLIEKLRSHPKRVVFTEGEDLRVLRAAERLVAAEAAVPVLLGSRDKIRAMAADNGVSLKFINVIEPAKSSDLGLFCQRFAKVERYRNNSAADPVDTVSRPHYFGAMMVQYGQADALVGGNQSLPASLFRALIHTIQPLPSVPKMFGMMVLVAPHLQHFGKEGVLFLADCGLLPQPTVDQLAAITIETGKLAKHFLGREPNIALLSHSTKGSAGTDDARRMAAAAALAIDKAKEAYLDFHITGEVQADVALDPTASEIKLPDAPHREPADVLVFPNLDAAHISLKLLQHCAGAINYGQILGGLARPCAQVPRTASEETIFGTAAAVGVEAIKYHQLYPDGEV